MEGLAGNSDSASSEQEQSGLNHGVNESVVSQELETARQHPMHTRLRDNLVQPKKFTNRTTRYSENARRFAASDTALGSTTTLSTILEPSSLQEAMESSE